MCIRDRASTLTASIIFGQDFFGSAARTRGARASHWITKTQGLKSETNQGYIILSKASEMEIQKEQQNQKCMKLMPKHPSKHPKTSQHIPESLILVTLIFGVTRDHYGGGQAVVG